METKRRRNWVKILIVAVPIWLVISGSIGLWAHFHYEEKERLEQAHVYRKDINAASLADDFAKITRQIGPRHHATENGRVGLLRMAAMIEGALGVNNIGYDIKKIAGSESAGIAAPLLVTDVMRRKTKEEIWVIVPYDSPEAMPAGAASASAVSVSFAVAQSMVGQPIERNVRFLYIPMAHAEEQERLDMAARVQRLIDSSGAAVQVLVLGAMVHAGELTALTRDAQQPLVFEMNLPAALLMKKPEGEMTALLEDGIQAPASILAQSADQVVQVLWRMAGTVQKK
jgi:hypothetical protein